MGKQMRKNCYVGAHDTGQCTWSCSSCPACAAGLPPRSRFTICLCWNLKIFGRAVDARKEETVRLRRLVVYGPTVGPLMD